MKVVLVYNIYEMDKLVKLLNEYHFSGTEYVGYYLDEEENRIYFRTKVVDKGLIDEQRISNERIISKKFGFIKWLVDNDKIDFESENYPLKKYYPYFNDDVLAIVSQDCNTYEDHCRVCYDKYESLLMLLAIQDEPIEFLISLLK